MLIQLLFSAALLIAGSLISYTARADNRPAPPNHMLVTPHRPKGLPAGIAHQMPPKGFHDVPPSFRNQIPRRAPPPIASKGNTSVHPIGRPGHDLSTFRGHEFSHFTAPERAAWQGGRWHYAWHRGHRGWWWIIDDAWFFYPAPIYPYPPYIGSLDYYDYSEWFGTPDYYWYYCTNPEGYYPYVQECLGTWHAVPPAPE